jgi:hypothetical protein
MAHAIIQVGDYVRSFDFEGRCLTGPRAAYVEGFVEEIGEMREGCPRYRIKVKRRIFGGKEVPVVPNEEWVLPPVNGTPMMFSGKVCDGVLRIQPTRISESVILRTYCGSQQEAQIQAEFQGLVVAYGSESWFVAFETGPDSPETPHLFVEKGSKIPTDEIPIPGTKRDSAVKEVAS